MKFNNERLINAIIKSGYLKSPKIKKAFLEVDRSHFLRSGAMSAYYDMPLLIGKGQTNSQPSVVAFMLELLDPQEGEKILDIGSGSGWTTALLCYLVGQNGEVTGVERFDELVQFGSNNLQKFNPYNNCKIIKAKEDYLGIKGKQFDKILISASAEYFPEILLEQLGENGTIVMPIKNSIFKITKEKDEIEKTEFPGFVFVPLIM